MGVVQKDWPVISDYTAASSMTISGESPSGLRVMHGFPNLFAVLSQASPAIFESVQTAAAKCRAWFHRPGPLQMWGHHCEGVEASLLGFNRDLVTVMDVG